MLRIQVRCDYKKFTEWGDAISKRLIVVTREMAQDLVNDINTSAPVDTGALSHSCYVSMMEFSGYAEALDALKRLNPKCKDTPIAEVPSPTKPDQANVGIVAPYWQYVEYGTVYAPAQPFVNPAIQRSQERIRAKIWEVTTTMVVD